MFFKYEGCNVVPKLISGILAELQKKETFGSFAKVNLKPIGDKKFLFPI